MTDIAAEACNWLTVATKIKPQEPFHKDWHSRKHVQNLLEHTKNIQEAEERPRSVLLGTALVRSWK